MIDLIEVKSLTVINLVDNETDGMSSPCSCIMTIPNNNGKVDDRVAIYTQEIAARLTQDNELNMNRLCHAAHGLSLLLIAEYDQDIDGKIVPMKKHLLMDGGPDPNVWRENVKKCGVDLKKIDNIVLSHYHIDHSNGLRAAVEDISKEKSQSNLAPVVVDLHHSQIVTRGFKVRGKIYPMVPDNPTSAEFESMGAKVELHQKGHLVDDCFYVSGRIPRHTDYETGLPGHFRQIDGKHGKQWVPDEEIDDERYIACRIKGRGVVVFSSCSHAGIVNVCKSATEETASTLTAVIGGFHLAGSSVEDRIDATIDALKDLKPDILLAGHCTGWRAKAKLASAFPYNFQPLSVGGSYKFNSMQQR